MTNVQSIVDSAAATGITDAVAAVRKVLDRRHVKDSEWFSLLHEACSRLRVMRRKKKALKTRKIRAEQAAGQLSLRLPPPGTA